MRRRNSFARGGGLDSVDKIQVASVTTGSSETTAAGLMRRLRGFVSGAETLVASEVMAAHFQGEADRYVMTARGGGRKLTGLEANTHSLLLECETSAFWSDERLDALDEFYRLLPPPPPPPPVASPAFSWFDPDFYLLVVSVLGPAVAVGAAAAASGADRGITDLALEGVLSQAAFRLGKGSWRMALPFLLAKAAPKQEAKDAGVAKVLSAQDSRQGSVLALHLQGGYEAKVFAGLFETAAAFVGPTRSRYTEAAVLVASLVGRVLARAMVISSLVALLNIALVKAASGGPREADDFFAKDVAAAFVSASRELLINLNPMVRRVSPLTLAFDGLTGFPVDVPGIFERLGRAEIINAARVAAMVVDFGALVVAESIDSPSARTLVANVEITKTVAFYVETILTSIAPGDFAASVVASAVGSSVGSKSAKLAFTAAVTTLELYTNGRGSAWAWDFISSGPMQYRSHRVGFRDLNQLSEMSKGGTMYKQMDLHAFGAYGNATATGMLSPEHLFMVFQCQGRLKVPDTLSQFDKFGSVEVTTSVPSRYAAAFATCVMVSPQYTAFSFQRPGQQEDTAAYDKMIYAAKSRIDNTIRSGLASGPPLSQSDLNGASVIFLFAALPLVLARITRPFRGASRRLRMPS